MTSLAVLIDQLFGPAPGGQGTYIRELIPALARTDPSLDFTLFRSRLTRPTSSEPWIEEYRVERLPWSIRRAYPSWALFGRPKLPTSVASTDILHAPTPAGVPPAASGQRSVVTVHDVAFLARPDLFPRRWLWIYRAGLARAVRKADALIAVSEHTADDLLRRAQADPAKVQVVPLAASVPATEPDIGGTLARFELRTPYILFVGTLEPRKNLVALVRAYRRLTGRGVDHSLVLAGGWGWNSGPLRQELAIDAPGNIVVTGRVSPEDVDALYRGATALVYPSLYEGFGLPVLEAMGRGIPCIASRTTSLPDVAGDAAILVDPKSIDEMASAIERVINDPSLREDLRNRGLARAAEFSWDRTARGTLEVYKSLL